MILDAETFGQVAAVDRILRGVEGLELPGSLKTELFASVFEINTNVCATAVRGRRGAARASARRGCCRRARRASRSRPPRRIRSPAPRRSRSSRRSATSRSSATAASRCAARACRGCTCTSACRRVRTAGAASMRSSRGCRSCSACRPTRPGSRASSTGWRRTARRSSPSCRAPARRPRSRRTRNGSRGSSGSPRSGSPRTTRASGGTSARIRSSGTLEVRVPDQPTDVHLSAAFAALLQALCATALDGGLPVNALLLADRGRADYSQNRWSAARFGPRARLVHPDGSSYVPADELGGRAARARPARGARTRRRRTARAPRSRCAAKPTCSSQPESARAAAADLVTRSLG